MGTASKHRIVTQHNVPTEIWELVYRLAKKSGGFVDPELVENQWKMIFYPKPDQKAKPVQGDTGAAVEEEEDIDLTESVKVQAQLLKVAGTQDQYVVEFKNKDYGSQLLFHKMLTFMKGDLAQKSGLAKLASEQQE